MKFKHLCIKSISANANTRSIREPDLGQNFKILDINVLSDNLIHAPNIFMSVSPCDSKISTSSNSRTGIDPPKLRNYNGIFKNHILMRYTDNFINVI